MAMNTILFITCGFICFNFCLSLLLIKAFNALNLNDASQFSPAFMRSLIFAKITDDDRQVETSYSHFFFCFCFFFSLHVIKRIRKRRDHEGSKLINRREEVTKEAQTINADVRRYK
jgi:hypothetical protein